MASYQIALVYTGMPVGLVRDVESALRAEMPDDALTFRTFSDPSIIADAIANGAPSPEAARRLAALYMSAATAGADAILNICSSVGDIAALAQPLFARLGVPLVRIDEAMAREAVGRHTRIGVMATLPTTLEPTKRLLRASAAATGRAIETVDLLASVFGAGDDAMTDALTQAALPRLGDVDCLLLAQGSMHPAREALAQRTGLEVFSSPGFGARAIREALKKGACR